MLKLRRFVCKIFGFAFLLSLVPLAGFAIGLSRILTSPRFSQIHTGKLLLFVMPAVAALFAVVYGMAWWSVKTAKSHARAWAITASVAMMLTGTLLLLLIAVLTFANAETHRAHLSAAEMRGVTEYIGIHAILFVGSGIAGLVAFWGYGRNAEPVTPQKVPRIAGDGTSGLLDFLAVALAVAGYYIGEGLWFRWGQKQGLPMIHGGVFWVLLLLAVLTDAFLHETGHASIGMLLGMKLRIFIVGPFQFRVRDGQWRFQFLLSKAFSGGGAAGLVATDPSQPMWCELCMIAAGPIFSLMTGLAGAVVTLSVVGTPYASDWLFFALVSTFGFVSFVVNLLPLRPEALYSDGARIYQLLSGGRWAELHRAMAIPISTGVSPLRPRDYDIEAINKVSAWLMTGSQALLMRLFAVSYYLDSGRPAEALAPLEEAERIYHESASSVPADLLTAFVFDTAFLRRDTAAARKWWDAMEAKKPTHFGVDYWLAKSALLWSERRMEEADAAWRRGAVLADRLPVAGTYMFDRFRYTELRRELDGTMNAPLVQPVVVEVSPQSGLEPQTGREFAPVLD